MKLFEQNPVRFEDDDQRWYTDRYLERRSSISLDYCNIFQSVAFEVEGDFTLTYNRLYNNKTHTFLPASSPASNNAIASSPNSLVRVAVIC